MKNASNIRFLSALILLSTLTGCYSVKRSVEKSKPESEQINWPEEYRPSEAGFFVHNTIEIEAEPQVVWDLLINAESWHLWYEGMKNVKVRSNDEGKLDTETVLSFETMGQYFETVTVREFDPPYRLSWESVRNDIQGYHAWMIVPTEAGCKVITSESQHGLKAFLQKAFLPNKLRKLHDVWLEEFKRKAENEAISEIN